MKKMLLIVGSVLGLASVANAESIIPASVATSFADGLTDIGTVIGLVFGVVVTLYVFRAVKSTFSK